MINTSFFYTPYKSQNQWIYTDESSGVQLWIKREDEIHPVVSGNKFRKLKYNVVKAKEEGFEKLLTFGGAFSNHIAATAAAAQLMKMKSVGIIRGEELAVQMKDLKFLNATLQKAKEAGMELYFETRENYRNKHTASLLEKYEKLFGKFYLIPEGGTNLLAIQGCQEILTQEDEWYDVICCAGGTGGTAAGLIKSIHNHQEVMVFSALKGDFLKSAIQGWGVSRPWTLRTDFHFGGYAKVTPSLVDFINRFYKTYGIPLDPIYTGKMLFGLHQLIKSGYFSENTRILAIHTGGLQGVHGVNEKLKKQSTEIIKFN